ncbi:hypothetical protein BDR07DRAFT_1378604 [Suillus spraguei]|nr:hypothetical protein BDR07DRAFT_1378604 [Suillus spraguei]
MLIYLWVAFDKIEQAATIFWCGLQSMDREIITQAVSAKQATHEKLRLCLLMTAWEIEETKCHKRLLDLLQQRNAQEYVEASKEAHLFERFMTHCHTNQLKDDFDFGVGTYERELQAFGVSEEQSNQLEAFAVDHNFHDPNQTITKDRYPMDRFINGAESDDDDKICYDDEDWNSHSRGEAPEGEEYEYDESISEVSSDGLGIKGEGFVLEASSEVTPSFLY